MSSPRRLYSNGLFKGGRESRWEKHKSYLFSEITVTDAGSGGVVPRPGRRR